MTLWLVLTLMMAVAAGLLTLPFLRGHAPGAGGADAGLELYRRQARELEADLARGAVSPEDAAATRAELERRALAAARAAEGERMTDTTPGGRAIGIAIAAGAVTLGAAALYGVVGRPDLAAPVAPAPGPAAAAVAAAPAPAPAAGSGALADVDTMIARLADRLAREPGDAAGWRMLGWSYLGTGRFAEAERAYAKAAALLPGDAGVLAEQGEARVRGSGGRVDVAARELFARALAIDPAEPRATFFRGLAMDQDGDAAGAVNLWLDLLARAPAGAPWVEDLKARIRERAGAAGLDLSGRPELAEGAGAAAGERPSSDAGPGPEAAPGPDAADMAAAAAMSPEDRQAMIRGMVEGLEARLAGAPDDIEGWLRLLRAWSVLGEREKAAAALARARAAFAGRPAETARLAAAATELGLE
ncbi:MAG: c-type cytochrome biogenesis protein CcmI [Rhodobacteraceae bacterium]|nr:c-type cytochrome biogenesis protein CcmI [Paracoccaceae bacterium]